MCARKYQNKWRLKYPERYLEKYLNRDVFLNTGIRIDKRSHSGSYHKMPKGLNATKTKLIAYRDISSCEKNYLGMESEILKQSELNLVVLNIDELLNYIQ